ncbi:hypothetical protein LTS08_006017 [Lithohypha guttulata]|uniref:Uncharacterized protein n=1 Tax=Lithohypha guttulata TaxID=1690604 RepID=A0AAN7SVZ5_9EURO|nr:hypothetical protein LTR05_006596 [Lithohypha guttulata]KAK5099435.1 hypothetical protein LTS08_006017 [Lithohypha guttulata]
MAAILNGFLPVRRRDQFAQEKILNTRWGDATISAPIHGGWNDNPISQQESPNPDQDLPLTPPQIQNEREGVYIIRDGDDAHSQQDWDDETTTKVRDNFTITIPLPWKKKIKQNRRSIGSNVLKPQGTFIQRIEPMPLLATAEAAATIPLPDSRVSSPIGRSTTTSPVLSFRSRLASPSMGDILSPVAEGFAKDGPSTSSRPTPVLSTLQSAETVPVERPSTASSTRSNPPRRSSLTSHHSDGIAAATMTSQATMEDYSSDVQRPPSRGIGATAHMRASSHVSRPNSRGPRAPSVERFTRRAPSVEPVSELAEPPAIDPTPVFQGVLNLEPLRRRAPSVEPLRRRAPSLEPHARRAPSIEPVPRRAPPADPFTRRAPSVETISTRRALSREPRGRRALSIEPRPRVRFHSEAAPKPARRHDSFSSNDGSIDSESDNAGLLETDNALPNTVRFDRDYKSVRKPIRRRSIASPISSPTSAAFGITEVVVPSPYNSLSAQVGVEPATQSSIPQRNAPRNRSKSRTRGLYADMHDDFRLLARDVAMSTTTPAAVTSPSLTDASAAILPQYGHNVLNAANLRTPSPALTSNPPTSLSSGIAVAAALRIQPEPQGYSSDSSLTALPSVSHAGHPSTVQQQADNANGKAVLAAMARERKDQLRREERERAREKVARKLEHERERVLANSVFSDTESVASGSMSGSEKTRRVYGGSVGSEAEWQSLAIKNKTLVPNAEDIWG